MREGHSASAATERSGAWALARGFRLTWARARAGWGALRPGAFGRWARATGIGLVACAVLTWGLTALGHWLAPRGLDAWDRRALEAIARGPMSFPDAILAESPGNLSYLIPLTLAAAVLAARAGRPLRALSFLAAYVLARPLIFLGWKLWDRPRPRIIAEGIAAPPMHSYPSGHVVLALAVYGLLAYLWARASRSAAERVLAWGLLAAWVGMIGWARLRLGTHWPSDTLASAVLGAAWLAAVLIGLKHGEAGEAPAEEPEQSTLPRQDR